MCLNVLNDYFKFLVVCILQGHAVSQLCRTVEDVVTYGTASSHKHEAVKDNVTSVFDRAADYCQEVRK